MKCLNCVKESAGRSKYCSDKCKVSYNRNKKRNTVSVTNPPVTVEPHVPVTPIDEIPVTIKSGTGFDTPVKWDKESESASGSKGCFVVDESVQVKLDKPERGGGITIPDGVKSVPIRPKTEKQFMNAVRDIVKPANFGFPDCECKHCQYNRTYGNKFTLNHGVWKRVSKLGKLELNRVSLPGDVDYVGVAV